MESVRAVEPMTPNTTVENARLDRSSSITMSPAGLKRKVADGEPVGSRDEDKENGGLEKKAKTEASSSSSSLVELKGRKLLFRQEALSRNLPRRRLLNFEGFLLDEMEAKREVVEIPEEHWDLIVMAGHEQSSSSETILAKNIRAALNLSKGDEEILPVKTIEPLIPKLFSLQQYGFIPNDFSPSASSAAKIPAALQIRCWEANEPEKYLPADQHHLSEARKAERVQARQECLRILDGLDDVEKVDLIRGDKSEKPEKAAKATKAHRAGEDVKVTEIVQQESPRVQERRRSREGTANTVDSRRSASPTKKSKLTPEEEDAARAKREEKEAKKTATAEKKAAKEREERKREAAKAKQAQTMNAFFKPKTVPSPSISRASPAGPSTLKRAPLISETNDYARTFRPMAQRPNVHVAEYNRWASRWRERDGSVGNDVFSGAQNKRRDTEPADVAEWMPQDFLADHLRRHGRRARSSRANLPKGIKSMPSHGPVADVWNAVQDAEDPREVLNQLRDRTKYPWKILAFDQQTRPPYCGTFTKKSVVVGPRTPFAQDPIFDYSYDSGDDWQDDEGGEDVDDFGESAPVEDEETEDEEDGEFDDWLDDSEDVEFTPAEGEAESTSLPDGGLDQTRLPTSMKVVKKAREIPKKVVKLTPYWKGPVWENSLGGVGSDGLEAYRIQLLNETPISVNPFTFTSTDPPQSYKASFSTTVIGSSLGVRCLLSTETVTNKPQPIPAGAEPQNGDVTVKASSSIISTPSDGQTPARSKVSGPKLAFPTTHLLELFNYIEGSTKIRTDLVSFLREKFEGVSTITKAAIEAKIKEVAVREGKAKDSPWRVKPEAWIAAGLTPPDITIVSPFTGLGASVPTTTPALSSTPEAASQASEPIVVD